MPLADKRAVTLATSLLAELEKVLESWPSHLQCNQKLLHVIIGDGIASNLAASEYVAEAVRSKRVAFSGSYRLVVFRCAAHQANLSCRAAALPTNVRKVSKTSLPATALRWSKFVTNDYFEELSENLYAWIDETLEIVSAADAPAG